MSQEMKNEIIFWCGTVAAIVFVSCLMVLLTGCSHNLVTYGDGFQLELGYIPNEYKLTFTGRYGKILTVCARENTEVEMEGGGNAGTDGGKASGKLRIKVGPQITGYLVDALKAGVRAEQLEQYLKTMNTMNTVNTAPGAAK